MKIVVGSANPVKVKAARAVFGQITDDLSVIGIEVESGVPAQPWGNEETRQGAVNRAHAALQAALSDGPADLGVGFEGGVFEAAQGLMTCAWCAVVDRDGTVGIGGGVSVLLPPAVAAALRAGHELGTAMDRLVGAHNTKQGPGAVGILTAGLIDRQVAYEHMLALALAPFRRPDLYRLAAVPRTEDSDHDRA
ncbi:MAG: inosine/xanthosine triphosphatase [Anaerolineae bacterium]